MSNNYFKTKYGLMYYEVYDECSDNISEERDTIILLHGWGMNCETFRDVINDLKSDFKILCIDMYGFGKSDEPLIVLQLEDYVFALKSLIDYLKIKNPIIIGHSFGGRVAISYGAVYDYKKLFLVNSPAFKNRSFRYYKKIFKYKLKKFFLWVFDKNKYYDYVYSSGSIDYKMCSYIMKGTFKKVVRKDLTEELKKLKGNVVIISSVNDMQVKYKDNIKMYKLINNSEMYAFYNSNHFSYIEEYLKFINIIRKHCK